MYVCHCNALTDRDVKEAVEDGAKTAAEVYETCGCCVRCGNCAGTVAGYVAKFSHTVTAGKQAE